MKAMLKSFSLPAAALALALGTGVASAQSVAQTPLSQPIQTSGSVNPSRPSSCGVLGDGAVQVLQVNQDFAAVDIAVNGTSGLTLLIQGSNGFSECHTGGGGTINAPGLLNQGTYSFFIGNSSPTSTSYSLTIREN
ncbi:MULTISPECIES: hypothetical protein [Cyanophyceae]|uniref:Peptidase C-terminal archaeal/bacterial domain-containing protein n=1 Tax=Leptolyngbya subtilissima DQ-A4 TaxID=2933933 RepID=A0ABV0KC81_9CYAN|nr:hypothetical protein [Nodosilinea sp. FACHB-141]MBD2113679.1 hypothetical protein [Nodosilinea sp. FACHB-141]